MAGDVTRDWVRWHDGYAEPGSSLARRLTVVRECLREAVRTAPGDGVLRVASMCAGDGRDVLPVLAESGRGRAAEVLLVELDPGLAGQARDTAEALGLSGVTVRTGDAGAVAQYEGVAPLHLLVACGVFGNISVADAHRTIGALPSLLAEGAAVVWTRGRGGGAEDPSLDLRERFAAEGFAEVRFVAPEDARYRVGVHRRAFTGTGKQTDSRPGQEPRRLFSFE